MTGCPVADITLYTTASKVKKVDRFDLAAYKKRHGIGSIPLAEEEPCHTLATKCSGCPTPNEELCWRYRRESGR